jgi:ApeA N-terminal domain 1
VDAFESAGAWWLPESPNTQVMGLLGYSDEDGFRLEIPLGFLGEKAHFASKFNQSKNLPIVYGLLRNGKTITLFDVWMTNMSLNLPGAGTEEYKCLLGFIGDIESVANPRIDQVQFNYLHLRDWVEWHPCKATIPLKEDQLSNSIVYHYEAPADIELATGDCWRITLSHKANMIMPSVKGFQLKHDCILTLELDEHLTFDEVEDRFLTPIWQFLSFCLDRGTHIEELKIRPYGQHSWLDVGRAQSKVALSKDIVTDPFLLLSMQQLSERTAKVLGRWIDFKGDERRAVSLLIGINDDYGSTYSDLRFLTAAQALEAMSRVEANENEIDDTEFNHRLSVVLKSVEDRRVRDWAKRKLKYANSRNASELLKDLVNDIGKYASTLAPDQQKFLHDIRDNRNFYTHRDDRRAQRVLEGNELYVLTQGLVCLLKAAVLRRLDFSQEEIHDLMNDCQGCLVWSSRVARQYEVS